MTAWLPYPAYKPSGIDWLRQIPAHWATRQLKRLCRLNPRKSEVSNLPVDTDVSFVPMEDVGEDGSFVLRQVKPLGDVCQGYTYFRDGDVVVAKITPCFENGKGTLFSNLHNEIGFGTTEFHVLRAERGLEARFLLYITRSRDFRALGKAHMYGAAGQQRVPESFVADFEAPLPSVPEQQVIADFLDRETTRIDALVVRFERLIALLAERRAALISHAVTKGLDPDVPMKDSGIPWLGEIPAHWEAVPLKRAIRPKAGAIKTGPFGSQLLSAEMTGGEVKVYNQRSVIARDLAGGDEYITRQKYEQLRSFTVEPDDVLVTTRGTIGRCLVVPDSAELGILHPCLMRIQPEPSQLEASFLIYLIEDSTLVKRQLFEQSNATTIDVIYSGTMREVIIPLPSVAEQRAIVDFLDREVNSLGKALLRSHTGIDHLREYRTALISAAVTGKIDVREAIR